MIKTTCCYCGVGCGIVIRTDARGALTLEGDADHPGSRGMLCSKGRTLLHTTGPEGRLTTPLIRDRKGGPLRAATWDEAIAKVAGGFTAIRDAHGPDALALYVSGQCLTEEYYLANKLAKGCWGTNNIDTNSRLCMSSAVAGYKQSLGADSVPTTYDDFEQAETFLFAGSNAAWTHPIIFRRIEARKRAAPERVRLICIDPRRTDTAQASDLHLPIRPGTDVALFHALARALRVRGDWDRGFIARHTVGVAELEAVIEPWTPEAAGAVCGVEPAAIRQAAAWLGDGRAFLSLWTMGLNQSAMGVEKNVALINLSLVTGAIGRPGCGPFSLTGQPNAMGGREVGGLANLLPSHRDLAKAEDRAAVEAFWGVPAGTIAPKPGLTAMEQRDALLDGRLKGLWVMCSNPLASWPDEAKARAALANAELLVVSEMVMTATAELADVVLPAAAWLEKTGTMTSSERRITRLDPALPAPGQAKPDCWIIQQVGRAMGYGCHFAQADEAAIYAEHAALTAGRDCDVSGVTYDRLAAGSLQWPVPAADHPGTERLYTDHRFAHPDGKARLKAPAFAITSEQPDAAFPLVLTTGRIRDQWHTQARTGRVARLRDHLPRPFCEIHPIDAAARGIAAGVPVRVRSRRGACTVLAEITDRVPPGTVFVPMHWGPEFAGGAGNSNAATSDRVDPVSKEPDLKYAAVQVEPAAAPPRRIVVVGGGAGALAFARRHRALSPADTITVLAGEGADLYDRVQLPAYIDGAKSWADLVRATAGGLADEGITVLAGRTAIALDRGARTVTDDAGTVHAYDVCVLATGSRAAAPAGPLAGRGGVFTLRTRQDAERIAAAAVPGAHLVVQGAGVLGIELAHSLHARGCRVTVLARGRRLIGRSLDQRASDLLVAHLRGSGIDVRLDATIASAEGDPLTAITLGDGTRLPCDGVAVATGTVPAVDLARAAGLACGRGVTVDAWMRTSDPALLAIGECTEFRDACWGTTAAATAMAEAAAEWLRGNPHAPFAGAPISTIVKLPGLPLAACGVVEPEPGDQVVRWEDEGLGHYALAVVRRDRLVGALCLGDTRPYPRLQQLIAAGTELGDDRRGLLLGGGAAAPRGRLVCSCNQVGEDDLRDAIRQHGRDPAVICDRTRAGTACGSCRGEVARMCAG
jgi:ferredoxin-nitrate reductase